MLKEILEDTEIGMEKSLGALDVAFKKIRTGRATPSLLDSIKVNYYDKLTPLAQVASISGKGKQVLMEGPPEICLSKLRYCLMMYSKEMVGISIVKHGALR